MPRLPPEEKRFSVDCRVKGVSKAYKRKRFGTVKTISHVGDGPKRRRRIEVEWDDHTCEVVLSNAISLIVEGEEELAVSGQSHDDDSRPLSLEINGNSDSEEENEAIDMPMTSVIDDNYNVFTTGNLVSMQAIASPNAMSQAAINHQALLATQHLNQKYHILGKLSEIGSFDYVSTSKRTRRKCVCCGKNSSYYCMKCSNLSDGKIVPVHNADYKEGCLFEHIEKVAQAAAQQAAIQQAELQHVEHSQTEI